MGGSLEIEAKPPQIGGGRYRARPSPHPEPPGTRAGRGGRGGAADLGRFRPIWGVGRWGERGDPPGRGMWAPPDPKSPPKNRRKTATIGRFDRFGRFSPQKMVLTGCVWGGVSWVFFAAPAGPAPARGDSESQIGAKNPQNRVCRNSREPEIGICAAFTPKWAVPGMEGEGELWVWPLSPPSKRPQSC